MMFKKIIGRSMPAPRQAGFTGQAREVVASLTKIGDGCTTSIGGSDSEAYHKAVSALGKMAKVAGIRVTTRHIKGSDSSIEVWRMA